MNKVTVFITFFLITYFAAFSQDAVVDELVIKGNEKIKTSYLKKISDIKSGIALDSIQIQNDVKTLKRLPVIKHIHFEVIEKDKGRYQVIYNVQENITIIPSLNIYTSNEGEFAYRIGASEFNFLGHNLTLGVLYQRDIYDSYRVNFRAPNLISKKIGVEINHQNLTTLEPVFFENSTANYRYNNNSIELLGLFQFNPRNLVELGVNYFTEDYEYREGVTDPGVPLNLETNKILYKGIYKYNNIDYYFQYLSGIKSELNLQYVTLTSNNTNFPEFFIWWNDISYFKRIGDKGNLASRLRLGLSSNDETPFAPFSVDNNLNVRGVGNTIDRGTGVVVLNTEYRHTYLDKKWYSLQGNFFVDAGTWRNPGGDFGDFSDTQNIRVYPGIGFRFINKRFYNAIFRVDYGYGITEDATNGFVFGIGQYF